jgi:hypothetical protein
VVTDPLHGRLPAEPPDLLPAPNRTLSLSLRRRLDERGECNNGAVLFAWLAASTNLANWLAASSNAASRELCENKVKRLKLTRRYVLSKTFHINSLSAS